MKNEVDPSNVFFQLYGKPWWPNLVPTKEATPSAKVNADIAT